MEPVREVQGRAVPFGLKNVDTDLIIPARWLKTVTREGLGRGAFEALRADPDNVFDRPEFVGAPIIIAVSAPTALAFRTAEEAGMTLVALVRGEEFDIFTHPQRVTTGVAKHVA